MNVLLKLKRYAENWKPVSSREFTEEEIASVSKAEVVASEYGMSVCFHMVDGGQTYMPVSRDSAPSIGDIVDLSTARYLQLERAGEVIDRIEII